MKVEKRYEDVITNNYNYTQKQMALAILLNAGKKDLLDDEIFNKTMNSIDNREPLPKGQMYLMTQDFEKDVIKLARSMAELSDVEIFRYIKKEISIPKPQKTNSERSR